MSLITKERERHKILKASFKLLWQVRAQHNGHAYRVSAYLVSYFWMEIQKEPVSTGIAVIIPSPSLTP